MREDQDYVAIAKRWPLQFKEAADFLDGVEWVPANILTHVRPTLYFDKCEEIRLSKYDVS